MCQLGNQRIFKECRDAIRRKLKVSRISNVEMRRVLAEHGGCMNGKVDSPARAVLASKK